MGAVIRIIWFPEKHTHTPLALNELVIISSYVSNQAVSLSLDAAQYGVSFEGLSEPAVLL